MDELMQFQLLQSYSVQDYAPKKKKKAKASSKVNESANIVMPGFSSGKKKKKKATTTTTAKTSRTANETKQIGLKNNPTQDHLDRMYDEALL